MKYIFLIFSLLPAGFSFGQTYYTGWDNASEQSGWMKYESGVTNSLNEWSYDPIPSTISSPNALTHYYPVGGTNVTDDWHVSPLFDFSNGGNIDSIYFKFSGFGTPLAGDTIGIYLLHNSPNPNLASSRIPLKIYSDTNYQNDNVWRLETDIPIPAISGDCYIAFRYKTIVNWLDVMFDNVSISENLNTSSTDYEYRQTPVIYPNPVYDRLQIDLSSIRKPISSLSVYNLQGQKMKIERRNNYLDVSSLQGGIYFLQIESEGNFYPIQKILKK